MLEVLFNVICGYLLAILGYYIIKIMISSTEKATKTTHLIFILNSILIVIIHFLSYSIFSPIIVFIINTITYKVIFKKSFEEALLATGILSLFILIADIIIVTIESIFINSTEIQNNFIIYILSNIGVITISILLIRIDYIASKLKKCYQTLFKKMLHLNVIFIVLLIIAASGMIYKISTNYKFNLSFITNMLVIISLFLICILYINKQYICNKLSNEYDILFESVKNFEEWIEKEQFLRHEYKNQLAIVYALSHEKEIKKKIAEIIKQNLDIENSIIQNFKNIPKGGLKGLLYYKTIVASKNKIRIVTDVSINDKGILSKLNRKKLEELSKLIGIFFDNAIEATLDTKKKTITLEIYELKDRVNIVISNPFKKGTIINNNFVKGKSSKGKGRGNGLYFAKQILMKNNWLLEKHEVIDKYYIETITVLKNTSK